MSKTIIEPSSGWVSLRLREVWEYRELALFLAWRDISVRYKQTVLGAAWAIIQPVFSMIIFSIFFGRLARVPSDGLPYPIFSYAALLPWSYFATAMAVGLTKLLGDAALRTSMGRAGNVDARRRYGLSRQADAFLTWYHEVIEDWRESARQAPYSPEMN
jgi:hypothetical protein